MKIKLFVVFKEVSRITLAFARIPGCFPFGKHLESSRKGGLESSGGQGDLQDGSGRMPTNINYNKYS